MKTEEPVLLLMTALCVFAWLGGLGSDVKQVCRLLTLDSLL